VGDGNGYKKRKSQFSSDNPNRTKPKKGSGGNVRDKSTIQRIQMYKNGGAIRNAAGRVVGGTFMMKDRAGDRKIDSSTGRVAPDRRWFGNTRVIGQKELDKFREEMSVKNADPYSFVLRRNKLPVGLLQDTTPTNRCHVLDTESYKSVIGGHKTRTRPKVDSADLSSLVQKAGSDNQVYDDRGVAGDSNLAVPRHLQDMREDLVGREVFKKGQSRRIWSEMYKVLDCSDVVIQVLDARNVPGTRSAHIEDYLKKHAAHKHLIFVINKCDLVPTWVTKKWVRLLSAEHPTLAFHASLTNSFGKGALIQLLRQFAVLHTDKKQISVGFIGYPNVGKSSVINTLKTKKVCNVAPVPGETKCGSTSRCSDGSS